mgnify:CR=1 FL=1
MTKRILLFIQVLAACSSYGQSISSGDINKYVQAINSTQLDINDKKCIDPSDNKEYIISFPKEPFNIFYSSGFAYQAVYKNAGADQLFATENLDFSQVKKVTALPVNSKSSLQVIQVYFGEVIVTQVIENGKKKSTIFSNSIDFYYPTGNTVIKNKLTAALDGLIALLTKERDNYHALKHGKLYMEGGVYDGGYTGSGRRENSGTMEYKDEPTYKGVWIYTGDWRNDQRHGKGTLKSEPHKPGDIITSDNFVPTEIYTGKWFHDVLQGTGTYEKENHLKYEGDFVNGKMEGTGKMTDKDKNTFYEGDFKNERYHGKGILTYMGTGISKYDGEFVNGLREGQGTQQYDKSRYEGAWKAGREEGYGIYTGENSRYEGYWKNGREEGEGKSLSSNGDRFSGSWKNGKAEGKGTMIYANKDSYEGNWSNGNKSGIGTYQWVNGDSYTGEWKSNEREGKGIMIYANGEKYDGQWKKGKYDGAGILYDKNNKKIKDLHSTMGQPTPDALSIGYLKKNCTLLNDDPEYTIAYRFTDSSFVLYSNHYWPFLFFDVNNNSKVDENIDREYYYLRGSGTQFYIKSPAGCGSSCRPATRWWLRQSNNILEISFPLTEISSTGVIAFQMSIKDQEAQLLLHLPARKDDIDFKKNKMYKIPIPQ